MRLRPGLVWLHRYLGLSILAFVILAGLTGSILIFRTRLDAFLNPKLFDVAVQGPVLAPARLADALARRHPSWRIIKLPIRLHRGRALVLGVTAAPDASPLSFSQVFVDPYTGRILGMRRNRPGWSRRHLIAAIFQLHQNLLLGRFGRWFMGIVAFGWVISNLLGLYLTFPGRPPFWQRWGKAWRVARGTRLPRFCLDLHRAGGLWFFLGLLILAVTSVEMNFFDALFLPSVNLIFGTPHGTLDAAALATPTPPVQISFEKSLRVAGKTAKANLPGWVPVFASYDPQLGLYGVSFIPRGDNTYAWLGPVEYFVSANGTHVAGQDDPYQEGARGLLLRSLYPLHSGRIFGWPTRAFVFVLGLATAVLSASGLYVWYRRR
jgi:uncharacterized iron-regulated membrane protein